MSLQFHLTWFDHHIILLGEKLQCLPALCLFPLTSKHCPHTLLSNPISLLTFFNRRDQFNACVEKKTFHKTRQFQIYSSWWPHNRNWGNGYKFFASKFLHDIQINTNKKSGCLNVLPLTSDSHCYTYPRSTWTFFSRKLLHLYSKISMHNVGGTIRLISSWPRLQPLEALPIMSTQRARFQKQAHEIFMYAYSSRALHPVCHQGGPYN